jgi:hypothetical protein
MSRNEYIWNILMMGTKYFKNIPMPCKNDMGNLSTCTWKKITKWMKKLDDYYIYELFG